MTAEATVCVVDENVGVRKSLRALPESAGLAVETYAYGEEFLAAYDPERQVMELLVACKTPKEIAVVMNVSVPTVEGHRRLVLAMMEEAES